MLEIYFSILIFTIVAILVGLLPISIALCMKHFVHPHSNKFTKDKLNTYECGCEIFHNARLKFNVHYYLMAILFVIFDLELIFLFPWALAVDQIGWSGFFAMGIFLGLLAIGFIYEWQKGAFKWP